MTSAPAPLAQPTVLFVCTANLCRSPLAAAMFANRAERRRLAVSTTSAGLLAGDHPVPDAGLRVAAERGLDLSRHRSRSLDDAMLDGADLIVTMAREHSRAVVAMQPDAFSRVATLGELDSWLADRPVPRHAHLRPWVEAASGGRPRSLLLGVGPDDVPDPMGRRLRVWRDVADLLEARIDRVVAALAPLLTP